MAAAAAAGWIGTWALVGGREVMRVRRRRPSLWIEGGWLSYSVGHGAVARRLASVEAIRAIRVAPAEYGDGGQAYYPVDLLTDEYRQLPLVFGSEEQARWVAARLLVTVADLREPHGYRG